MRTPTPTPTGTKKTTSGTAPASTAETPCAPTPAKDLTGSTRCDDTNPAHTHHIPRGFRRHPSVTVCETCEDYVEDPRLRPTSKGDDDEYDHGWVHIENDSSYCPGQGDDDTGDYASPRHTTIGDAFPDGLPD